MENIQNFLDWIKRWLAELVEMFHHVLHWMDKTFPKDDTTTTGETAA